jgi:septal ring factor EnvC (AmiA/AmiB activator)
MPVTWRILCFSLSSMAELDAIAESLRQHRKDLDEQFDRTATRSNETAKLLDKIQELARRSEATNRVFTAQQSEEKKT